MTDLLLVLQLAIEVAFAVLAIRTAASWARQPDRRHGNLAIAVGSLALLVLLAPAFDGSGPAAQALTDLGVVLFLVSGYGLVTFRDSFVPLGRGTTLVLTVSIVVVGLLAIVLQLPADTEAIHAPAQTLVLVAIVGLWSFCLLEPIVTFWLSARGRPAVERARLRSLSLGNAGLLAVVIIGTIAGSLGSWMTLAVDLLALAIVPLLYVAFFPPVWLRRIWRQPEEDEFRHALHDLLLYSKDRATLAERALGWAQRLVGGAAAFVLDSDESVLATRGIEPAAACALSEKGNFLKRGRGEDGHSPWRSGSSLVVPLDLSQGKGAMVIVSGRLSPMFGDDELSRLRQYATSIAAGLDRVTLTSRIAALERAKTDFLNIASHELRGPMTVIKGYLTMLDAGALGELSPKARDIVPLLVSKSDEVNWMIEQMIEAARLEEGRLALKRHRADVVELTKVSVDGVRILLSGHDVKLDVPKRAIEADVDPDRIQIVIRNLLSNAAKYSNPGSDIAVGVRRDRGAVLVSVGDRGVGISREDRAQLFTRFGRIASSAHVQGTGLGLWLSREIARMHDGDLTVESETGVGSTFTLSVPLSN